MKSQAVAAHTKAAAAATTATFPVALLVGAAVVVVRAVVQLNWPLVEPAP